MKISAFLGHNEVFHELEPMTQTLRIEPLSDPKCHNHHEHPKNLYCPSITENGLYIIHS